MKRPFAVAAALAALWAGPCLAVGTISLSLSQQLDTQGKPLSGCQLYFYQAGTTTPQNAYQDTGLTIPWPNPMTCDASGRVAQFFLADGYIKIRLADKFGSTILAADNLLVIGPSSGSGGGGSVDATTVLATGDVKTSYGTGTMTGFVRMNGRTIGSATSGATERANADAMALFEYLWGADANLTVSGGRGASAAADWGANKQLTLPDARGRFIAGMDDMGNTSAARLTALASTTLGAAGGSQAVTLTNASLPAISYTPTGTVSVVLADSGHTHSVVDPGHSHTLNDPGHTHTYNGVSNNNGCCLAGSGSSGIDLGTGSQTSGSRTTGITENAAATGIGIAGSGAGVSVSSQTFTGTLTNLGGAASPFAVAPPSMVMTLYLKL